MTITEEIANQYDFWNIFHNEWGKAHDSPNYSKKAWLEMADFISKCINLNEKATIRVEKK